MFSRTIALTGLLAVLAAGCGSGMLKTKGRVTKSGEPLVLKPGEDVCLYFYPLNADGTLGKTVFPAYFNAADSTFQVTGNDRNGMPPGKYRVAVEHTVNKKDLLKGAYDMMKSPYVFDVDSKTKEIVIDLDKPS